MLRRHEQHRVGRGDLVLYALGRRRIARFEVLVVERQLRQVDQLQLELPGRELGDRQRELRVELILAQAAVDDRDLGESHEIASFLLV